MKQYFSLSDKIGTWKLLNRFMVIGIFYSFLYILPQVFFNENNFFSAYYILIMTLNAIMYSIQIIQRLNDIQKPKIFVLFPFLIVLIYFKDLNIFFIISGIFGCILTLYIFFAPNKNFTDCINFWRKIGNEGGYAREYFRSSPYWRIEAYNEGFKENWYGPYRFPSYGHTFFVYCKTDDVSKYWEDYLKFRHK